MIRVALALLLVLSGCSATVPSPAPAASDAAAKLPVPMLKVGEPFAADLLGDGQATITVLATEVSAAQLIVKVKVLLNKAGKPVTGGPENFEFLDSGKLLYRPTTNGSPDELASVSLATTGQQIEGKIVFGVPPAQVAGGYLHLVTGQLVHAIWKI